MTNSYDGTAAVIVPQAIEKLPFAHWRPGSRTLTVGSRSGTVFSPDMEREESSTFHRAISTELIAASAKKLGVNALAATWCESLWFPQGLATVAAAAEATSLPLIVATNGLAEPATVVPWFDRVAAWLVVVDANNPGPAAAAIMAQGAHVEVLLGLDKRTAALPNLPWSSVSAVHIVSLHPADDPEARRTWATQARAQFAQLADHLAVYDEDHVHTDCTCGVRLIWRYGPKSRLEGLAADGSCTGCGKLSRIVLA